MIEIFDTLTLSMIFTVISVLYPVAFVVYLIQSNDNFSPFAILVFSPILVIFGIIILGIAMVGKIMMEYDKKKSKL